MNLKIFQNWNEVFPHWGHPIRFPTSLHPFIANAPQSSAEKEYALEIETASKVELHVHVEAGISAEFYNVLNREQRLYSSAEMPAMRTPFLTFRDFILAWVDNSKLVTHEEILFEMARSFVHERKKQNIVYTEAHVSAPDFTYLRLRFSSEKAPLDLEKTLCAYIGGIVQGERECPGIKVRLIADAVWPSTLDEFDLLERVFKRIMMSPINKDGQGKPIVVAVGLGGPELASRAEEILPFVLACRELGLKVDIHSGENTTVDEHRHSVQVLCPDRIAHGISGASEGWFFQGHISACPLSNMLTGSFKGKFNEHPIFQMNEKKLNFSVGSDDPLLFSNTLTLEYVALRNAFGWETEFFERTQRNAREAAFAI